MNIGPVVRKYREEYNVLPEELALKLRTSSKTIEKIENEGMDVDQRMLWMISTALDIPVNEFIDRTN